MSGPREGNVPSSCSHDVPVKICCCEYRLMLSNAFDLLSTFRCIPRDRDEAHSRPNKTSILLRPATAAQGQLREAGELPPQSPVSENLPQRLMHMCLFHGMRTAALLTFGVSQACLIPGVADLSFFLSVW